MNDVQGAATSYGRLLCILILVIAAPLMAEEPPAVITSVEPESGSTIGGTLVTIRGTNFDSGVLCFAPCPPVVRLGDGPEIGFLEFSDTGATFLSPPHEKGTVDVTLVRAGGSESTLADGFTFIETAQSSWSTLLLPIATEPINGGGGSRWVTEIAVHNGGSNPSFLAPVPCESDACPTVFPLDLTVAPGETLVNPPIGLQTPDDRSPGRLLYVTGLDHESTWFSLRVRDVMRHADDHGVELPVVRGSEALGSTFSLLDVPIDPNYRANLRIYDFSGLKQARVAIRLFDMDRPGAPPLASKSIMISPRDAGEFAVTPGYAQIFDIAGLLPTDGVLGAKVRIEIEPLTPGLRLWAMVSATNIITSNVTISTPQHP